MSYSSIFRFIACHKRNENFSLKFQARMKLPKKRRRVVAVEQPRRARRMGQGSVASGQQNRGGSGGGDGGGLHRRMNAIKSGGGQLQHSHTNHTTHGGTYRLPNTPHDKMGKCT